LDSTKQVCQLGYQVRTGLADSGGTRQDNDIQFCHVGRQLAKRFPSNPFYSVSVDRPSRDLLADDQSQPGVVEIVSNGVDGKTVVGDFAAAVEYPVEIRTIE